MIGTGRLTRDLGVPVVATSARFGEGLLELLQAIYDVATVENGVATLTGTMDSASEFRAAAKNAYDGGARLVVNNLKVK